MRKSVLIYCLFIFTVVFIVAACNDPIFYTIYQEVEPIDPRIKGAPSNLVVFNKAMYVASGSVIHRYNGPRDWDDDTIDSPGGRILQIASTKAKDESDKEFLYALCFYDRSSRVEFVLWQYDGDDWEALGGETDSYDSIQHIFPAGDVLFIGAENNVDSNTYTVLYVDKDEPDVKMAIKKLNITGEISGASYDGTNYYISTRGSGVFKIDPALEEATLIKDNNGNDVSVNFVGMINLGNSGNTIALITRTGAIYTIKDSVFSKEGNISFGGRLASGSLAIWEDRDDPSRKLLLAGRQDMLDYTVDSGYTYGYLELELDANGIKSGSDFNEPGIKDITTINVVDGYERYKSTIGKYPVNFILQTPPEIDSNRILFASTQKNGVWSYRQRSGGYQWNAEE